MIKSIQKVIRVGSSAAVTIPAKEMKRQDIEFGDEVEVVIRAIAKPETPEETVIQAAKQLLEDYRRDFENLAKR